MNYEKSLTAIHELMKQGQYQKALDLTVELKRVYWRDPSLHKLILTIKQKLQTQEQQTRSKYIKNGMTNLMAFWKKKDLAATIKAARELLSVDSSLGKAKIILKKAQKRYLKESLHQPQVKAWEEQHSYEKLYPFYSKLQRIFPESKHIKKLVKATEKKLLAQDRENKKEFILKSIGLLQEKYQAGEHEAVIDGCEDLIAYAHKNMKALKTLKQKATQSRQKDIEKNIIKVLKEAHKTVQLEYDQNPKRFIRI